VFEDIQEALNRPQRLSSREAAELRSRAEVVPPGELVDFYSRLGLPPTQNPTVALSGINYFLANKPAGPPRQLKVGDIDVTARKEGSWSGHFKVKNVPFQIHASSPEPGEYDISFIDPTASDSLGITGKMGHSAVAVSRRINTFVDRLIAEEKPHRITFSAALKEPSRVKAYNTASRILARRHGYNLEQKPEYGGMHYILTRKEGSQEEGTTMSAEPHEETFEEEFDREMKALGYTDVDLSGFDPDEARAWDTLLTEQRPATLDFSINAGDEILVRFYDATAQYLATRHGYQTERAADDQQVRYTLRRLEGVTLSAAPLESFEDSFNAFLRARGLS
jgi:hypothetical protein